MIEMLTMKLKDKKQQKKLDYEFIIVNPDGKDSDIYVEIGKIYNDIIESTKKSI